MENQKEKCALCGIAPAIGNSKLCAYCTENNRMAVREDWEREFDELSNKFDMEKLHNIKSFLRQLLASEKEKAIKEEREGLLPIEEISFYKQGREDEKQRWIYELENIVQSHAGKTPQEAIKEIIEGLKNR